MPRRTTRRPSAAPPPRSVCRSGEPRRSTVGRRLRFDVPVIAPLVPGPAPRPAGREGAGPGPAAPRVLRLRGRGLHALLLHAAGLALALAQEVELGPPHPRVPDHLHLLDGPRVQREDPLHPGAEGDLAHGHRRPGAAAPQADDEPLEDLHALALGLL